MLQGFTKSALAATPRSSNKAVEQVNLSDASCWFGNGLDPRVTFFPGVGAFSLCFIAVHT